MKKLVALILVIVMALTLTTAFSLEEDWISHEELWFSYKEILAHDKKCADLSQVAAYEYKVPFSALVLALGGENVAEKIDLRLGRDKNGRIAIACTRPDGLEFRWSEQVSPHVEDTRVHLLFPSSMITDVIRGSQVEYLPLQDVFDILWEGQYYKAGLLSVNVTFTEAQTVLLEVWVDGERVDYLLLAEEDFVLSSGTSILVHENVIDALVNE